MWYVVCGMWYVVMANGYNDIAVIYDTGYGITCCNGIYGNGMTLHIMVI